MCRSLSVASFLIFLFYWEFIFACPLVYHSWFYHTTFLRFIEIFFPRCETFVNSIKHWKYQLPLCFIVMWIHLVYYINKWLSELLNSSYNITLLQALNANSSCLYCWYMARMLLAWCSLWIFIKAMNNFKNYSGLPSWPCLKKVPGTFLGWKIVSMTFTTSPI